MSTEFAAWFNNQLKRRGWSPADFYRESGISRSTIYSWTKSTRVPDPESIDKIADVFGLPVDTVLTIAGHRPDVDELDPNDPRELIAARVRRMRPEPSNLMLLNTILDNWDAEHRNEGKEKG